MANGNDIIMLDQTKTKKMPYNTCGTWTINGNVSFYSWNGPPIINCSGNVLSFERNSSYSTAIEFQGLTFLDTFLRVYDVSLTIKKCSFGSFLPNSAYLYLIYVSVNKPLKNLEIYVNSVNFIEKNAAGCLNVFNQQSFPVIVELRNIKVIGNFLKTANFIIFIQGIVNFNVVNSEISQTKFFKNVSTPLLVYFHGCPDEDKPSDSKLSSNFLHFTDKDRSLVFHDLMTVSMSIIGTNFSSNHAGIAQAVFCYRGNVNIIDAMVSNNTNKWISGGSFVIDTQYKLNVGGINELDIVFEYSSFVSNINQDTGPLISVNALNMTLSLTNCTFSYNQAGSIYVSTLRSSKVIIRNCSVEFCKSFSQSVWSHCGGQVCVLFRYLDEYVPSVGSTIRSIPTARKSKNDKKLKVSETRPGFELEKDDNMFVKVNTSNSVLPTRPRPMNGEMFESGFLVEDCEFHNNTGFLSSSASFEVHSEPYIALDGEPMSYVRVRGCVFIGNVAKDGTGAMYVATNIAFNVTGSIFRNNVGSTSGAIYFSGSTLVIQNCTLDNNFGGYTAYTQATGSVRLTKQGTAFIQNSKIIQRNTSLMVSDVGTFHGNLGLSSDSFGNIILSNSVLDYQWSPSSEKVIVIEVSHTKMLELRGDTSIKCPWGYKVKRRIISESQQSFECDLCAEGSYSIVRGIYR